MPSEPKACSPCLGTSSASPTIDLHAWTSFLPRCWRAPFCTVKLKVLQSIQQLPWKAGLDHHPLASGLHSVSAPSNASGLSSVVVNRFLATPTSFTGRRQGGVEGRAPGGSSIPRLHSSPKFHVVSGCLFLLCCLLLLLLLLLPCLRLQLLLLLMMMTSLSWQLLPLMSPSLVL